jgi:hypothetical protein
MDLDDNATIFDTIERQTGLSAATDWQSYSQQYDCFLWQMHPMT